MKKTINNTVETIKPSGIRKFFDMASQYENVISLTVGEPNFPTPRPIKRAAIRAIEEGKTNYTTNRGLLELRKEICKFYNNKYNVQYNPETECIVTTGGSEGIDIALRTILNQGDEVLVTDPGYVAYTPLVELAGGIPSIIKLNEKDKFKLTPEILSKTITSNTKAIILNYPCNPTGAIMTKEDYSKIISILKDSGIFIIADEVYSELIYDNKFCSIASFPEIKEQCIVVNSFSKTYSMTGWRLGYLLAPNYLSKIILKIHQFATMSASTPAQYGALEGLQCCDSAVENMRKTYQERRDYCISQLNEIGLEFFKPEGAFYIFPSIKTTGLSSEEFCKKLLDVENVACVPGNAFGDAGEGYIRISYAYSLEELEIAFNKIKKFIQDLK